MAQISQLLGRHHYLRKNESRSPSYWLLCGDVVHIGVCRSSPGMIVDRTWPAMSRHIRARDDWRCRRCGVGQTLFDLTTGRPIRLTAMHLDRDPKQQRRMEPGLCLPLLSCCVRRARPDSCPSRATPPNQSGTRPVGTHSRTGVTPAMMRLRHT